MLTTTKFLRIISDLDQQSRVVLDRYTRERRTSDYREVQQIRVLTEFLEDCAMRVEVIKLRLD